MGTWSEGTRGRVVLPDGRAVRPRALRSGPVPEGTPAPELGLYLTARPHTENWPSTWVAWPDFGLPREVDELVRALRQAHRAAAEHRVEIACGGGVGRTGTAVALLARLAGLPARDAVGWAREHHHRRAVETPWQRRLVRRLDLSG